MGNMTGRFPLECSATTLGLESVPTGRSQLFSRPSVKSEVSPRPTLSCGALGHTCQKPDFGVNEFVQDEGIVGGWAGG